MHPSAYRLLESTVSRKGRNLCYECVCNCSYLSTYVGIATRRGEDLEAVWCLVNLSYYGTTMCTHVALPLDGSSNKSDDQLSVDAQFSSPPQECQEFSHSHAPSILVYGPNAGTEWACVLAYVFTIRGRRNLFIQRLLTVELL